MSALGRERAWSDSDGILLEITLENRRKFPVQIMAMSNNDPKSALAHNCKILQQVLILAGTAE